MQPTLISSQRSARSSTPSVRASVLSRGPTVRFIASILLALGIAGSAAAQGTATGSVEGRVLNVGNNRYLNNAKVVDEAAVPQPGDWLHGRFLVLRKGKRQVVVVERTA